jgi:hypothetical protein
MGFSGKDLHVPYQADPPLLVHALHVLTSGDDILERQPLVGADGAIGIVPALIGPP